MSRVRRTKQEIEAGMSVAQKQQSMSLETFLEQKERIKHSKTLLEENKKAIADSKRKKKRKPAAPIIETWDDVDHDYKTIYKYRVQEKIVEKEVPVIKEVRILNGTTKTQLTLQELLDQELQKCTWEWKEVKMDSTFRTTVLSELGKEGWRMTHIMEWRRIKADWKDKPDSIFFQRSKTKR
ncbi:MAG: hypothetical protein H8E12_15355 [Rhodobacteraceae bacterium]|nr:hypothetical protein [Paracoccaceae bacterium]